MAHLLVRNTVLSDRRLPLPGRVVVFGRSLEADVPVPHVSVSRRHALLEQGDGGWFVSDLGSVNGTFVGDRRLDPGERVLVSIGGSFRVGEVLFRVAPDEPLEEREPAGAAAVSSAAGLSPDAPAGPPARVVARSRQSRGPLVHPKPSPRRPGRPSASAAQRSARRKRKRDAMRWLGLAATIALLGCAGYFVSRIVDRERAKRDPAVEQRVEPEKRRSHEIEALTLPEKG